MKPSRHLIARCSCGTFEPFDVERLACSQRELAPAAIARRLRCVCGGRQVEVLEAAAMSPAPAQSRVFVWAS